MKSAAETRSNEGAVAIPAAINLSLAALHGLVNVYQFFVLPLWLLPANLAWAWTLLPLAILNNPHWSLIHEAIHDLLLPARQINALMGRALAIMFGAPFRILRLSHLLHHKLNRTPKEGTEFFDRGQTTVGRAAFGYYFQILAGLYLVEFMSSLVFFLPHRWLKEFQERSMGASTVSGILMQNWLQPDALREIRVDGAITLAWFALALFCYGSHWPILVIVVGSRAFLISFLDNVYHYRTPVNDIFYANNLCLPGWMAKVFLYFNFHGIHHQNPSLPWICLPSVFRARSESMRGNYFVAALSQLRGPVALQDLPWAR